MGFAKWREYLEKHDKEGLSALLSMNESEREAAFALPLAFGTGGLRGILGMGPGRMNEYCVRRVTDGVAAFIRDAGGKACAIAYDTRRFSLEFARAAAETLCARGIRVFLFDRPAPTPLLSHAVRSLSCDCGIVITASHNPRQYNGYKVYDSRGVQLLPGDAKKATACIDAQPWFTQPRMDIDEAAQKGLLVWLSDAQINAYVRDTKAQLPPFTQKRPLSIVYSALHGTGANAVPKLLAALGFDRITLVQQRPDGDFGGLYAPNPELPEVYARAREAAGKAGADILLATDPDCDRVGVMARHGGEYIPLMGNQIGALLCDYILSKTENVTSDDFIVTTVVSGDMGERIAKAYGARCLRTLTGFKYIGDLAQREPGRFRFGYEESYGYLTGSAARDKDATLASALILQMAAESDSDLIDRFDALCAKYGASEEKLISIDVPGVDFKQKIAASLERLAALGEAQRLGDGGLKIYFPDHAWIAARPSGTEPKMKLYLSATASSRDIARARVDEIEGKARELIR